MSLESEWTEHYRDVRQRLWKPAVTVQSTPPKPISSHPARDKMEKLLGRAKDVIKPHEGKWFILLSEREVLPWKRIVLEVCEKHQMTFNEIRAHRRNKYIVLARQEAMWRLKQETLMSLPTIGRLMGGFDHTTALHGIRAHAKRNNLEAGK